MLRIAARSLVPIRDGRIQLRRWLVALGFLPVLCVVQAGNWIALLLDELLFPGYRRTPIHNPLFVVGVPRSGTTSLHRVLAADTDRFTTLRMWELLLAPSILQKRLLLALGRADRRVGRPLHRLVQRMERRLVADMDHIHRLSLHAPEEDFLLLLPVMHCFALIVAFPRSEDIWRVSRFDEAVPERRRRRVMAFYRSCLQRHLHVFGQGRRLLSKNVSFTPFIRSLRATFPDAAIVGCCRDPKKVVPSQLSSLQPGLRFFGHNPDDGDFRSRIAAMLAFYYRHLSKELCHGNDDRRLVIDIEQLKADPEGTVRRMYRCAGLEPGPRFSGHLRAFARESSAYRSSHEYSLEQFGWTEKAIDAMFQASCSLEPPEAERARGVQPPCRQADRPGRDLAEP
jgi:hypothetical protein